jgi:hypothetical protein
MYEVEGLIQAAREAARGVESKDSAERLLIKAMNIVRAQSYLTDEEKDDMVAKIRNVGYSLGCSF